MNRNIIMVILFLALLPVLVAGYTQAVDVAPPGGWFTDEAEIDTNTFKAGTVIIDAEKTNSGSYTAEGTSSTSVDLPGGYYRIEYNIQNTGTKSIYLRAYFDGYWKKIYHKNTATVTATALTAGGPTITARDSAYFYYNNPNQNQSPTSAQTVGFSDKDYSVAGPEITFGTFTPPDPGNSSDNGGNDNGGGVDPSCCNPADFSTWPTLTFTDTDLSISGRGIVPEFFNTGSLPANNPHPDQLDLPTDCLVYVAKIHPSGQGETRVFEHYTKAGENNPRWHEREDLKYGSADFQLYINSFSNTEYAGFDTVNKNVYYAFAKGGTYGNLYRYYPNPYQGGVPSDCWLRAPTADLSHMTIYYCEKPPKPDITIEKYVLLGYDNNNDPIWRRVNDGLGDMELQQGVTPQFKLVVTNTGQVDLVGVVVEDDVLDLTDGSKTWNIGNLPVEGIAKELIIDNNSWWEEQLSTEDIIIKLCGNQDWLHQGEQILPIYFYYNGKIAGGNSVPLCVEVYLKPGSEDRYNGSVFVLNSYFEAVQASHPEIMVDDNWLGHPIDTD